MKIRIYYLEKTRVGKELRKLCNKIKTYKFYDVN